MTTCPTWKELKAIVRGGEGKMEAFLGSLPDEHKTAGALALSVAHWDPSERKWMWKHREFYEDSCGLCIQFHERGFCGECPLNKVSNCYHGGSLWMEVHLLSPNAYYASLPTDKFNDAADKLYNVLVDLYRKEWEKL